LISHILQTNCIILLKLAKHKHYKLDGLNNTNQFSPNPKGWEAQDQGV
jgi:hypothetical protein